MRAGKRMRTGNKGYAMVTVIIVVAFVSILATTLLYISGINFQMKSVDYHIKENFYEAERPLENIKAKFTILAAEAAQQAYSEVLPEAAVLRDNDMMQKKFNEIFFAYIQNKWDSEIQPWLSAPPDDECTADHDWDVQVDRGYMDAKGFHVHYTANGYVSYIDTDFRITAPKMDWPVQAAKTVWDAADTDLLPETADYSKCVSYVNWVKR